MKALTENEVQRVHQLLEFLVSKQLTIDEAIVEQRQVVGRELYGLLSVAGPDYTRDVLRGLLDMVDKTADASKARVEALHMSKEVLFELAKLPVRGPLPGRKL